MPESVLVNGIRITYSVSGDGDPVLLICGTGMPAAAWDLFTVPALVEAGYRVVTFDNRGVPPSEMPPAPYTIAEMVDDTAGLLDLLGLGPCCIAGYSMGGFIAEELARRRPELVRALVLIASAGRATAFHRLRTRASLALAQVLDPVPADLDTVDLLVNFTSLEQRQNDDAAIEARLEQLGVLAPFRNPGRVGQAEADMAWVLDATRTSRWTEVRCPCLCVAFAQDPFLPPSVVQEAAAAMPQGEYLEIPDAGHSGPFTQPAALNRALLDFFART